MPFATQQSVRSRTRRSNSTTRGPRNMPVYRVHRYMAPACTTATLRPARERARGACSHRQRRCPCPRHVDGPRRPNDPCAFQIPNHAPYPALQEFLPGVRAPAIPHRAFPPEPLGTFGPAQRHAPERRKPRRPRAALQLLHTSTSTTSTFRDAPATGGDIQLRRHARAAPSAAAELGAANNASVPAPDAAAPAHADNRVCERLAAVAGGRREYLEDQFGQWQAQGAPAPAGTESEDRPATASSCRARRAATQSSRRAHDTDTTTRRPAAAADVAGPATPARTRTGVVFRRGATALYVTGVLDAFSAIEPRIAFSHDGWNESSSLLRWNGAGCAPQPYVKYLLDSWVTTLTTPVRI